MAAGLNRLWYLSFTTGFQSWVTKAIRIRVDQVFTNSCKKKEQIYRKTKTLCHPLRNKTKSFTCTCDRSFRLSSNCLRPCDWLELFPFGFGFTTLNPVLNECAWVMIYAAIYPHDRSNSTLATILDEWRVTQQSHSKEPPVDRLMRHAWKAKFTRMS